MSSKQSRYLKRPEDFKYRIEAFVPEDLQLMESLILDLELDESIFNQIAAKTNNSKDSGYAYFSAKDGFTKQLVGLCGYSLYNDKGTFRLEEMLVHSNHSKRGLTRMLIQQSEAHLKEMYGGFNSFYLALSGKVKAFQKNGWNHQDDLLIFEKSKLRCRFSDRKTFENQELKISSLKKAVAEGWMVESLSKSGVIPSDNGLKQDLENLEGKFVVIRMHSSIKDYILFKISTDVIIFYDFNFTSEEFKKSLISFINNEVVIKGFRKIVGYAPSRSSSFVDLKEMGFFRNPFNFGGSNAKFPILTKNIDSNASGDTLTPFHFCNQYWGDYLIEY